MLPPFDRVPVTLYGYCLYPHLPGTTVPMTGRFSLWSCNRSQENTIAYWQHLAGNNTVMITSPDFIAGTERIRQSALLPTQSR
ncbi:MAG: hypothetical protein PHD25_08440 [Bacteroidales bacterium]|nr:hypothetical protein [Bacteroidales bacterium]